MTREEMWKEFEKQLIRETRTPITVSYDVSEKMTKSAIERTVAKWKERLEQEPTTENDKIDCEHTDCNNCVNHKYCDYESTTKNDLAVDLISRKAVIDELKRYFHDEYYQRTSIQDCRDCFIEDVLNHLPSVTPIRPKGHWIEERNDYGEIEHWHCSKCYDYTGFITTCKWDYCPSCGSDNREVEE